MKKIVKFISISPFLLVLCMLLFAFRTAGAAVSSVTLTPTNPDTMSNILGYYLAGKEYTFTVNVQSDAAGYANIGEVRLVIENGASDIDISINPDGVTLSPASGIISVSGINSAAVNIIIVENIAPGDPTDIDVQFNVTFRWDISNLAWDTGGSSRAITGSATVGDSGSDYMPISYGIATEIKVLNFTLGGEAADGKVNKWHASFGATGDQIVYNIPGADITDAVNTVLAAAEVSNTELYIDTNPTGSTDNTPAGLSYTVPAAFLNTSGYSASTAVIPAVKVRATMATAGGPVDSSNSLSLYCNEIKVTGIFFFDGGGVNDSPNYYRHTTLVTGTQVRINAELAAGGGTMEGDTTFELVDTDGNTSTLVTITDGTKYGILLLDDTVTITAGSTEAKTYEVINVYNGAYGSSATNGQYNDDSSRIDQSGFTNPVIWWDNGDPPGQNSAPFTAWVGSSQASSSLTFQWTPLTEGGADVDADFYTYRIYYRKQGDVTYLSSDVATDSTLGSISTSEGTITGLSSLTNYEYYIVAEDLFGQEVTLGNSLPTGAIATLNTLATSIQVAITDGVDTYNDSSFTTNLNASARPVRETAIKVTFTIDLDDALPDNINLIAAPVGVDGDLIIAGVIDGTLTLNTDYFRFACERQTLRSQDYSTWVVYIPETHTLIQNGNDIRFIVEIDYSGTMTYADHDFELEAPPGEPNDQEWTFSVSTQTQFTPWPVRILNNVITRSNPAAYPAYYLTADAYVTIRVYDIKGRIVATLLDGSLRKGGINIKENGWRAVNRANRKVGVGLYYIHIKAKRVSNGKVILNKFKKVVVAK